MYISIKTSAECLYFSQFLLPCASYSHLLSPKDLWWTLRHSLPWTLDSTFAKSNPDVTKRDGLKYRGQLY